MWIVTTNELYHYGMPKRSGRYPFGSGERPFQSLSKSTRNRYQNDDGSLTDAGKAAKEKYINTNAFKKTRNTYYQNLKGDINDVTDVGNEAVKTGKSVLRLYDHLTKKEYALDLSNMSDQELQKAINRMNLEQNYTRLISNQKTTSKGRQVVEDILDVTGDVVTVGGSIAAMALAINKIRGA